MQKKVEYWKYAAVFSHSDSFERIQRNIGFGRYFVRVSQMADIIKELLIVASFFLAWLNSNSSRNDFSNIFVRFLRTFYYNELASNVLFMKIFDRTQLT